jgi:hypothetical protein
MMRYNESAYFIAAARLALSLGLRAGRKGHCDQ